MFCRERIEGWFQTLLVDKQGISKKFLSFISGLDKSAGHRALGPEQTISGKVQSTLKEAHTRAKGIDEQKGYSKTAQGVYLPSLSSLSLLTRTLCSIMRKPLLRPSASQSCPSTPALLSKYATFMKKRFASSSTRLRPQPPLRRLLPRLSSPSLLNESLILTFEVLSQDLSWTSVLVLLHDGCRSEDLRYAACTSFRSNPTFQCMPEPAPEILPGIEEGSTSHFRIRLLAPRWVLSCETNILHG